MFDDGEQHEQRAAFLARLHAGIVNVVVCNAAIFFLPHQRKKHIFYLYCQFFIKFIANCALFISVIKMYWLVYIYFINNAAPTYTPPLRTNRTPFP